MALSSSVQHKGYIIPWSNHQRVLGHSTPLPHKNAPPIFRLRHVVIIWLILLQRPVNKHVHPFVHTRFLHTKTFWKTFDIKLLLVFFTSFVLCIIVFFYARKANKRQVSNEWIKIFFSAEYYTHSFDSQVTASLFLSFFLLDWKRGRRNNENKLS